MSDGQVQTNAPDNVAANAAAANAAANDAGQNQNGQQQANGNGHGQQNDQQQNGAQQRTIAEGVNGQQKEQEAAKPYWPDDWREKMADHYAAGDKKKYEKELERLQRMDTPLNIHGSWRSIENTWASKQFIKKPGKDAKPEELAEFQKELGWTEKPEDLVNQLQLDNGAVLGDTDKPVLTSFIQAVHGATSAQEFASKATNWYLKNQEDAAAQLDQRDESFRVEAERALKEELGAGFKRRINATASLFSSATGGMNIENEGSLRARLLGGRMADGSIIGNDPDFNRWLISLAQEVNPVGSVVEDGDQSGKSVDAEIEEIMKYRRENKNAYYKDEPKQARLRELLAAKEKAKARA